MGQLQKKLDVISNNIANVNTIGYKASTANFSSLLVQNINNLSSGDGAAARLTPPGIRQGNGAKLAHTNKNMSMGSITQTERALDVALTNEKQFFQVFVTNNGITETQFTRAGNFYIQPVNNNEQVMLVTAEGHPVVGVQGPILINNGFDAIEINESGQVVVTRGGQKQAEAVLEVVQIDLPRVLESAGGSRYRFPDGLGNDIDTLAYPLAFGEIQLQTGSLESSNVNLSEELTSMMETQRAYQFNARAVTISDDMMGLINQLRS
jgi:flagellar basal-body rod protein FlgG